jgi:transcriptional regulator with XRE-family HTH domain
VGWKLAMSASLDTAVKIKIFLASTCLFGANLRRLCKEKRFSQEALAQRLDVDPTAVSHWMCGKRLPGPESVCRAGKTLELSSSELKNFLFAYIYTSTFDIYTGMLDEAMKSGQEDMIEAAVSLIINDLAHVSEFLQSRIE